MSGRMAFQRRVGSVRTGAPGPAAVAPENASAKPKDEPPSRRKDLRIPIEDGDSYSPLNDHSRLVKRNDFIRYYADRRRYVYTAQLMHAVKAELGNAGYANFRAKILKCANGKSCEGELDDAERNALAVARAAVDYRAPGRLRTSAYALLTLGGVIPSIWSTVSNAAFTSSISVLLSLFMQAQNEAQNLVNDQESWLDAQKFVVNFFQIGLMVVSALAAVQIINYCTYCWKSNERVLREARFNYIMDRYRDANPNIANYFLEYNTNCDPDVAMMYFTNREEVRGEASMFTRWGQILCVSVDPKLAVLPLLREFVVFSSEEITAGRGGDA